MSVKPIPEGYHTVTPYLIVKGVDRLIDFLKEAFQAEEPVPPHRNEDGSIMHAELIIGDSKVMLADANEQFPPVPSTLHLYVEDCDKVYQRAIKAGGVSIKEPEDQFYGDRNGGAKDPSGNAWWISTHVEDVSAEEMERRSKELGK
jgi:PhnB protein